jgi:hypothetical protein
MQKIEKELQLKENDYRKVRLILIGMTFEECSRIRLFEVSQSAAGQED